MKNARYGQRKFDKFSWNIRKRDVLEQPRFTVKLLKICLIFNLGSVLVDPTH